jgi:hypothetical protein
VSGPEVAKAQIAAFRAWQAFTGERFAKLRKIGQPCLVIDGVFDMMIPVRNSYLLSEHLPNAVLLTFPDSGHGSLFQFHESFTRQAATFLASESEFAPFWVARLPNQEIAMKTVKAASIFVAECGEGALWTSRPPTFRALGSSTARQGIRRSRPSSCCTAFPHPRTHSTTSFRVCWSDLQLAYFAGYAMWTYLNIPFLLARPGVESEEVEPWQESGETWRRLKVRFPADIATHSTEQTLYFDRQGLLRRQDYNVEIDGTAGAAHYVYDHKEFSGIVFPTKRRVFRRQPDGRSAPEPLIISIDLDRIVLG